MGQLPFPPSLDSRDEIEAEAEERHHTEVRQSFREYERYHMRLLQKHIADLRTLPRDDQELLITKCGHLRHIASVASGIKANQAVFDQIFRDGVHSGGLSDVSSKMETIRSLLRQVARDWSGECVQERQAYGLIVEELGQHVPHGSRVLVPGAGMGRLAYEVAKTGYATQGCEYSLYMLLMSQYVLNSGQQVTIYPYLFPFSNLRRASSHLQGVLVPDVVPDLPGTASFSMLAGDFAQIYSGQSRCWDAVVTCFFIDTANNIVQYLRLIYELLLAGGVWINFGPLLWHWEGSPQGEVSIEVTLEDVFTLARELGFTLVSSSVVHSQYAQHCQSMLQSTYQCSLAVFRK